MLTQYCTVPDYHVGMALLIVLQGKSTGFGSIMLGIINYSTSFRAWNYTLFTFLPFHNLFTYCIFVVPYCPVCSLTDLQINKNEVITD